MNNQKSDYNVDQRKEKNWVEIESTFLNRYKVERCISFDYGLNSDFRKEDVEDLIHIINSRNGRCPFSKIYLGVYNSEVQKLLEMCSPFVKELYLAHWGYRDDQFFPDELPQNLQFKKLRKLNIKLVTDDDGCGKCDVKKFFKFITEIFRGTLSLEELSCNFPGFWEGEAVEQLVRSVVTSDIPLNFLYKLELSGCLIPTQLLILSALDNLHLTQMSLQLRGFLVNPAPKYLKRFLESQSRSLVSLNIEDVDSTTKCVISFPKMERLKKLCITGSKILGETGIHFEGVNYKIHFPVLEDLTFIRVGENEWKNFVEDPSEECKTLKKFEVCDSDMNATAKSYKERVKFMFPNLEAFVPLKSSF